MLPLDGAVQHYAWGSRTALPAALGVPADGRPWAELWWGTHPAGPTYATTPAGDRIMLADLTGGLDFLVKVLTVDQPLSLQVHPTTAQAEEGFAAEQARGVPVDAPERAYRDANGKPEVLVAVTDFTARCGFRAPENIIGELVTCGPGGQALAEELSRRGSAATVGWLLTDRPELDIDHPLVHRLNGAYPGDPGAAVALLLEPVDLAPGEAVFLAPGQLHMYLQGVGLEVMGASDNVVRGGLTPKHVDVAELLRIVDPAPRPPTRYRPDGCGWYPLPTDVFAVQALGLACSWTATGEIVVRLDGAGGTAAYWAPAGHQVHWAGGTGIRVAAAVTDD
jgi:mannose-6-phosphate isomerase